MTEEAAEAAESDATEETDAASNAEGGSPSSGAEAHADESTPDASDADQGAPDADDLAERVAEYDEELAEEVRSRAERLEATIEERDAEIDDLTSRLKRTQADFQNYKKRAKKRQDQLKERATEDLVERLVTVRDNLLRALDQDEGTDIRGGVESTLKEFDRILDDENVAPIEPEPGDEVDPHRHEVMMRVDSDEPGGTVADVYQPGYEMGEKVIRAAQVTVSEGDDAGE
jgi:molecular chaperone GrpE